MNIHRLSEKQLLFLTDRLSPVKNVELKLNAENILIQRGFENLSCLNEILIEPKPWQIETAIKALRDMGGNALLADEVGLGKTIECGLILKEQLHKKLISSVLILVPASLVSQWIFEMEEKFGLIFKDIRDKDWEENNLLISSLPLLVRSETKKNIILQKMFDVVVVDEAHQLKNNKTSSYKLVYNLQRKNTLLMSATPIQNDLEELYNLTNILKPGYFKNKNQFKEEFMQNRFTPKNVKKLKELLNSIMIRHKRSNTLTELPKRSVKNIDIEFNHNERFFYNSVIDFCKNIYHKYTEGIISLKKGQVQLLTLILLSLLKQNCSSPNSVIKTLETKMLHRLSKTEEKEICLELIQLGKSLQTTSKFDILLNMIKNTNHQYIIFSEYRDTINMLEKNFINNGIDVVVYHGGLNHKEKQKSINIFKNKEKQVFLSSESGGQGLNLQFCHKMINYDLPWNPMKIEQRIGRVHRFGQKEEVEIINFATKGTLEEYILFVLTSKLNLFEMVIGELDTIMSYMLNETSIDIQIGNIILGSKDTVEIEEKLRLIGDNILTAKNELYKDINNNSKILDQIGVSD